jgi:hypothetical protein
MDMIATTLIEWFTRFPALWAVAGIAFSFLGAFIAVVVMFLIWKKYGPKRDEMSEKLAESQKLQLDSLERTMRLQIEGGQSSLKMQKEHYESELKECREKAERDIAAAIAEKKTAEQLLHEKRNGWQAEKLEMTALIEQLKSRPDITTLFEFETKANERREKFYTDLTTTMQDIVESGKKSNEAITEHDAEVGERTKLMMESLSGLLTQSKKEMRVLGIILREMREDKKKKLAEVKPPK